MAERDEIAGHVFRQRDHLLDLQIAEDAVVRRLAVPAEQAEEQEHVALPHALVGQMGLRGTDLSEGAGAVIEEHRIVMAQILRPDPAPAGARGVVAQPEIAIAGARSHARRDRQAERKSAVRAIHDRRGSAARSAVEPLAAEDDPHAAPRVSGPRPRFGPRGRPAPARPARPATASSPPAFRRDDGAARNAGRSSCFHRPRSRVRPRCAVP